MADEEEGEAHGKGKKGKGKGKDKGESGGGKSNLVPAIIIAVGMVLGGKFVGGGKTAAAPADAHASAAADEHEMDCEAEDAKKPPKPGIVYSMDSFPINLTDGHYLKLGLALKLVAGIDKKHFEEQGTYVLAKDQAIAVLGGRDPAELSTKKAMEEAKEAITEKVRPMMHCEVLEVLFTEFVTQ